MKYLTLFSFALFLFSCSDSVESTTSNIVDTTTTKAVETKEEIQKVVEKVAPATEEMTEQGEGLMRGTFMYYADAAIFIECETGKKFNVAGDDYLALEKEYMKQRTKDFEKIYVEIKGEIKPMVGMEGTKKVETVVVDEMITMDATKSCS